MPRRKSTELITRSYVVDKTIDQFLTTEVETCNDGTNKSMIVREVMHKHIDKKIK